jgi:4-amino-4-deoxy-L-arabinose transferase-like glycosyltransferase
MTAALGVVRARRAGRGRWIWLVASGTVLGLIAMIRPLEGLCVALLLAAWAFGSAPVTGWVRRLAPVVVLAGISAAVSFLQAVYNHGLTGGATVFPVMRYLNLQYGEGSNELGFGANRGFGWTGLDPFPGHGPIDVAINSALNTFLVNVELLGWSIGSLLLILFLLAWGRPRRADWLMVIAGLGVVAAHAFYWFSGGPDFGARYWYLVLVPGLALTVRGFETLGERLKTGLGDRVGPARALAAAGLLSLSAMVTFMPWRAADKYWHYRNMRPDIRQIAKERHFGADLIIVRGARHPDYASAAVYNPIDLKAPQPIYVWQREPEIVAEVLRAYADRNVWVIDGPTLTHDGFRVVAGPVPARRMLEQLTEGK